MYTIYESKNKQFILWCTPLLYLNYFGCYGLESHMQ